MSGSIPVTQYGSIFAAIGCRLNFQSNTAQLEVWEVPKTLRKVIDAALEDIAHFEDTSNFSDGMSSLVLAQFIDGEPTPIAERIKANILHALGIWKEGRFVAQQLAQQKTNRSWHVSEKPNECTYFGDLCTHRGVAVIPGKRGRKSTRNPDQYHRLTTGGEITREQLVTPNVETLMDAIPADNLVSVTAGSTVGINLDKLDDDQISQMIEKIRQIQEQRQKGQAVVVEPT